MTTQQQHNPNRFLSANKWSRFCHSWITELIHLCHKQGTLYLNDLYGILPQHESKKLIEKLEDYWLNGIKRHPNRASLLRATIHTMFGRCRKLFCKVCRIASRIKLFS
ncbi:unnamed protein product [Rotaria socialis]|uniref:Uncharacterized protein n=2 Tax=Rotaria socialis TaxID=392032 RepID=A0A821N1Y9_9BILA|nr:unnamed protein product [Rotaria socialis]CAF4776714.1 unnamed protein product [Rotaria socialis]